MIFVGLSGYESKRCQKITAPEVNVVEPAMPQYLWWSGFAISFDRSDHPDHIPNPRKFPLVVDPLVRNVRLTKVLMDGGSGLNILHVKTLDEMEIPWSEVNPTRVSFHGIVPGKTARPFGQVALEVTFGTPANFRIETLTFKVIDFSSS